MLRAKNQFRVLQRLREEKLALIEALLPFADLYNETAELCNYCGGQGGKWVEDDFVHYDSCPKAQATYLLVSLGALKRASRNHGA